MDYESNLGRKIRSLREKKKLTRENFCEDQSQLSVRQLFRIENGLSLPTLPKLIYISSKLEISLGELFKEFEFEIYD